MMARTRRLIGALLVLMLALPVMTRAQVGKSQVVVDANTA